MTGFPKEKPERDEGYLDWIRGCPCHKCGRPAQYLDRNQAHHVETGGTATKCSDYKTVPLCPRCHAWADKSKQSVEELLPVAMAYRIYYQRYIEGGT